jgi:hypothetical protein
MLTPTMAYSTQISDEGQEYSSNYQGFDSWRTIVACGIKYPLSAKLWREFQVPTLNRNKKYFLGGYNVKCITADRWQ